MFKYKNHEKARRINFFFALLSVPCLSQNDEKKITWTRTLREVSITPNKSPDTVIGSKHWMIFDFTFCEKGLLILTYTKNEKKCSLQLLKENGEIELVKNEIKEPIAFFESELKNNFLETKYEVFQIACLENSIELYPFDKQLYYSTIKAFNGSNSCAYFMNNWNREKPEFNYLVVDKASKKVDTLTNIRDQYLYDQYYSEYKFLSFKDRCEMKRLAYETGLDKYDLAANYTGYTRSFWWEPLYSPLFIQNDTALIFDHYSNNYPKYTCSTAPVETQKFDFHMHKDYKNRIVQDFSDETLFALYFRNGKTILSKINTQTGEAEHNFELFYRYVSHLKIKEGKAYYLYRPFESSQNTFLYAEFLK